MREKKGENEERRYAFFSHRECEYFPCHKTDDPDNFNCLFCYCPLYMLGRKCGGNFRYNEKGYKDCSHCLIPHKRQNFDYIVKKYKEIAELMRENDPEGAGKITEKEPEKECTINPAKAEESST